MCVFILLIVCFSLYISANVFYFGKKIFWKTAVNKCVMLLTLTLIAFFSFFNVRGRGLGLCLVH